jgi:hypothetical protein
MVERRGCWWSSSAIGRAQVRALLAQLLLRFESTAGAAQHLPLCVVCCLLLLMLQVCWAEP